jgi:hypothetical protein
LFQSFRLASLVVLVQNLPMPKKPYKYAETEQKALEMITSILNPDDVETIKKAADNFSGQLPVLGSAFGAFVIGRLYGWRVLRIVYDAKTYSKYQKLLGIKFSDVFEERGALATRSQGLRWADKNDEFWKIIRGQISVEGRQNADLENS